eukprot:1183183-Pyramimonas_sp.AAC.1
MGLLKVKGVLTNRPLGSEGAPPSKKTYDDAQADEKDSVNMEETIDQQKYKTLSVEIPSASADGESPVQQMPSLSGAPPLPWWDPNDES